MTGNEQLSIRTKKLIKANDVIKVSMSINLQNVPDDLTVFDVLDYNRKYSISYRSGEDFFACVDFETEAGYSDSFDDNIEEYIKENLANDIDEIDEYEIFDVDTEGYEYQTAKIKIKSIK